MSEKEVAALSKKLDQIMFYLHNDDKTGHKGLVSKVEDLHNDFHDFKNKYETNQAIRKTAMGIYGAIGAGIFVAAKWLVTMLIEHINLVK